VSTDRPGGESRTWAFRHDVPDPSRAGGMAMLWSSPDVHVLHVVLLLRVAGRRVLRLMLMLLRVRRRLRRGANRRYAAKRNGNHANEKRRRHTCRQPPLLSKSAN